MEAIWFGLRWAAYGIAFLLGLFVFLVAGLLIYFKIDEMRYEAEFRRHEAARREGREET